MSNYNFREALRKFDSSPKKAFALLFISHTEIEEEKDALAEQVDTLRQELIHSEATNSELNERLAPLSMNTFLKCLVPDRTADGTDPIDYELEKIKVDTLKEEIQNLSQYQVEVILKELRQHVGKTI